MHRFFLLTEEEWNSDDSIELTAEEIAAVAETVEDLKGSISLSPIP